MTALLTALATNPGLHHNFVRWVLDYASNLTPEITTDPFDKSGAAHNSTYRDWSSEFPVIQDGNYTITDKDKPPFICTEVKDDAFEVLYHQRAAMKREGSKNYDLTKGENFPKWHSWNQHYVSKIVQQYKIEDKNSIPKFIIRDSIKKSYLHIKEHSLLIENKNKINKIKAHNNISHFMSLRIFWDENSFVEELKTVSNKYKLKLNLDKVRIAWLRFRDANNILTTHFIVNDILDAIKKKENIDIPVLDIFQEAYIYAQLEKKNDYIIMPNVDTFFSNTQQIINFIQYYPEHYKAMNPNLPTFNNIPNPFYLWNLKK